MSQPSSGPDTGEDAGAAARDRVVAGRYRLRRRLGQGAMGTVWEAYDEFLRRTVAVKEVLLPPGVPDAEAAELRERTLREARAIAALSHPNVITLHDVAHEDGEPFVVTEYMPAHSVAELLTALGPLPTPVAAAIADAVAAGLAAAHQAGITHRDVKPGNVLVGGNGQVKLTDFGIARNVSEKTMTRTGIMLGSPCYIAPEVAVGDPVTPAADLWGLGATLFAVLEGEPPYDGGGSVVEVLNEVVHGEVPRPTHEGPLADLVAALMVKDPAGRLPLAEVRNRLHPLLPPPSTPLLSEEDLRRLAGAIGDDAPTKVTRPVAPQPPPNADTTASTLAPAPGPLPFAPTRAPRRRGVPPVVLVVVGVLLFLAAAGGGFALARIAGGESVLPPRPSAQPTTQVQDEPGEEFTPRTGDAATVNGAQGGGYQVEVPTDWMRFVEERQGEDQSSTRVYFVSPNGTQALTIERFPEYYPGHAIDEYIAMLGAKGDASFSPEDSAPLKGIDPKGIEPAQQLTYRTTAEAARLAPGVPNARNLNRVTFAALYPLGVDLWVVSVTVPIDQEDSGRRALFDRILPTFTVTG
ncbi:serine/threonine-protein kinase [Actinophytocola xanthii]|uniref:non-specific serine/threonine protein kinase n=1 Tax=Actinophytocola xanthii TaxID=1912961 RepID=A0A1Q8CAI3_9PSEU|nr:serine/threonine-protein kinase [Actinophytocola xanthii]OLF11377.1 hypothetical protein BU204_30225 [Actinophytocola xanthii]